MELEQRISNWLPALDKEIVELTVQKLQQCGVESLEHLKYVVEEDLQFLKPISRRILLERFHSAATPNPPVSLSPNDIQSPTSTQCASFSTPWEVFPPQLMKACQEGKRPVKSDLNEMEMASDDDLGDLPSCPFICAKGWTFLTANSYTICVDTHPVLHASKPDEAFKLLFFAHFAFNIQYQKETSLCLEFTQRAIAGINPARGTKVQKNGGKQHCLSPRVAALVTALKDYDFFL
ncbi:uncharacterized protein LOC144124531 [Amblyomma americanum]